MVENTSSSAEVILFLIKRIVGVDRLGLRQDWERRRSIVLGGVNYEEENTTEVNGF